jgi:hypothetical protein
VFSTAENIEQPSSAAQPEAINNEPQHIVGNSSKGGRKNPSSSVVNDYLLALSLERGTEKPLITKNLNPIIKA